MSLRFLFFIVWSLSGAAAVHAVATNTSVAFFGTNAVLLTSMELLDDKQRLGIGDHVTFRVVEDQVDPRALVVSDSGELEVPYIGRISAADKTCRELAQEIKKLLEKDLYYQATVILAVETLSKNRGKVYLVGQIRTSGPQEIPTDEPFTVSKAILKAGGFTNFSDKKHVKVTRKRGPGAENEVFIIDVSRILEKSKTDKDLILQPGDLIFVPARLVNF
jgi:protein involved in polysaccharide export with SLBB domain